MGKITNKLKLVPLEADFSVDQHTENPRFVLLRDFFTSRLFDFEGSCKGTPFG